MMYNTYCKVQKVQASIETVYLTYNRSLKSRMCLMVFAPTSQTSKGLQFEKVEITSRTSIKFVTIMLIYSSSLASVTLY